MVEGAVHLGGTHKCYVQIQPNVIFGYKKSVNKIAIGLDEDLCQKTRLAILALRIIFTAEAQIFNNSTITGFTFNFLTTFPLITKYLAYVQIETLVPEFPRETAEEKNKHYQTGKNLRQNQR